MLQNYTELAISLKEKFHSIQIWPEIELTKNDKAVLATLKDVTIVNDHSIQIKIEENHSIMPSQYILYAVCIKELAIALRQFLNLFEMYKKGKSQNEIGETLRNKSFAFENPNIDEYSKKIAFEPFVNTQYNLDAKSIVNGNAGNYKIRSSSDFFTSVILKIINVPDANSGILGKFIYELTEHLDTYNYFEKRFINKIPYIVKDNKINKFARKALSFLLQYDNLNAIKNTLFQNIEPSLVSIKDDSISLTSIFKKSLNLLSDEELMQGDKIRYFREPLYVNSQGEFVYLSTEWTDGTDSRLDLTNLSKLIDKYYPEFVLTRAEDSYFLKSTQDFRYTNLVSRPLSLNSIKIDFKNSGLRISDNLITRFTGSLLTKPFVILTGLSGSGKTKLAQLFAMWICESKRQYSIVPVGADWTNREPLLGFPNSLKSDEYVKPDNGALDIIIEASADETKPYFLILDEMNLSHVERYFADFLSVMESKDTIKLYEGEERKSTDGMRIPQSLSWPENLFIVGTVNIDETTYMFSPKVLDRSNVIEFNVTKNEMLDYLENTGELDLDGLEKGGSDMASDFIDLSKNRSLKTTDQENYQQTLLKFFDELKRAGAEFGYRSASEIMRFAAVVNTVDSAWDEDKILDAAVMQKLLPKVHGSRRRLAPVLETLGILCFKEDLMEKEKIKVYLNPADNTITIPELKYPLSFDKISRMYRNLINNGFTSYAEA